MNRVIVRGAPRLRPEPALRLEIRDLINKKENEKCWSLYVQAITNLKHPEKREKNPTDERTDPLAYFQISGIHGYPLIPYDEATPVKTGYGYCAHAKPHFPTWHRAYSLLFEQALQQEAMAIAKEYTVQEPEKTAWLEAAIALRQPYWDWALRGGAAPPAELVDPEVEYITIITKDGTSGRVPNPFLSYRFLDSLGLDPQARAVLGSETRRSPNFIKALTNPTVVFQRRRDALNSIVNLNTWPEFSNKGATGGNPVNSLETVHDGVHVNIGRSMGDSRAAAFDPIFQLHHCQIDRMLSLWRALHPNEWAKEDDHPLLQPFRDTPSSRWQSPGLTDTRELNYEYPELQGLDAGSPAGKRWLEAYLAYLYADKEDPGPKPTGLSGSSGGAALFADDPSDAAQVVAEDGEVYTTDRWTARLRCKAYESGGSFCVLVFIGNEADLSADPTEWWSSPSFVGQFAVFSNSEPETCANCVDNLDNLVECYVHLDTPLKDAVSPGDTDAVTSYLKDNLYYRVIQEDGDTYKAITLPSLEVFVRKDNISKCRGKPAITYSEPTYSEEFPHPY